MGVKQRAVQILMKIQGPNAILILLIIPYQPKKVIDFNGLKIAVKPQLFGRKEIHFLKTALSTFGLTEPFFCTQNPCHGLAAPAKFLF
jgi:hypothetical protein